MPQMGPPCDTRPMAAPASCGLPRRYGAPRWLGHFGSAQRAVALICVLAAFLGPSLGHTSDAPGRCLRAQGQTSSLKPVLHSILTLNDLSDVEALYRALHIEFRLTSPRRFGTDVERHAILTALSDYFEPSSFRYAVDADTQTGTTKIVLSFKPSAPLTLCAWGQEWKLKVDSGFSMVFDGPVAQDYYEDVHAAGEHPITLSTEDLSRDVTLTQTLPRLVSFPDKYSAVRNPHSQLLHHIVDVMLSGDLRETGRIGTLLQTDIVITNSRAGFQHGSLAQPLADADTSGVSYSMDEAGWQQWISGGPWRFPPPEPAARTVDLHIPVDTDAVCLSPQSIAQELKRRNVAVEADSFDKRERPFGADRQYSIRGNNLITLTDWVSGPCISELSLHQVTDVLHDVPYPLHFVESDIAADSSDALTTAGQAKINALVWRLQRRTACHVDLVINESPSAAKAEQVAVRQLASQVRRALIRQGVAADRLGLAPEVNRTRGEQSGAHSAPAAFVSVQDAAVSGCLP